MIYLTLFAEFVKIGFFAVGGGLATLPFLYDLAEKYTWFTRDELLNMTAVAQSVPGPLGTNLAAYAGFKAGGIAGGVAAVFGILAPALIIGVVVSRAFKKYSENSSVKAAFQALRPATAGLIAAAGWRVVSSAIIGAGEKYSVNMSAFLFFLLLLFLTNKYKLHPALYIIFAGIAGIFIAF